MSTRGVVSLLLLILLLVTLHLTNPSKEKHFELLKTKMADLYSLDMGNDDTFENRFQYRNYYFFSFTSDKIGDAHETTSVGILWFVF